ncbi:MAG: general secretion pathway protein GspM [Desulfobacca sp.]|nr:general secretion pathway protein GspM [Desulfobacca sp.]
MKVLDSLKEKFGGLQKRTRLQWGIGLVCLLLLVILLNAVNSKVSFLTKNRQARESDLREMLFLKQRYQEVRAKAQKRNNLMATTLSDDSPARIIEEIGIKGKGSQIKQLKGEGREGYGEDAVEVRIEGLSANEMVNLIFQLEKGTKPVIIKKALIKTRFDDPANFDLTLILVLLKPNRQALM